MGKRPLSEMKATGGDGGDDDHGVFDSTAKRPSSIIPASGGAGGDEHHGVSDSTAKRPSSIIHARGGAGFSDSTAGDEPDLPTYNLDTLADHINRFDTDPKILDELSKRVTSDREAQTIWFEELRKSWTNPETPADASRLVKEVLRRLYGGYVFVVDLEGFLSHYGLPQSWELDPTLRMRIKGCAFTPLMFAAYDAELSP